MSKLLLGKGKLFINERDVGNVPEISIRYDTRGSYIMDWSTDVIDEANLALFYGGLQHVTLLYDTVTGPLDYSVALTAREPVLMTPLLFDLRNGEDWLELLFEVDLGPRNPFEVKFRDE